MESILSTLLLLPAVLTAGLAVYAWNRRTTSGASILVVMMVGVTLATLGYGLGLISHELEAKLFWAKTYYLGQYICLPAWLTLALWFTGEEDWLRPPRLALVSLPFVLLLALRWTDESHHLFYQEAWLQTGTLLSVVGKIPGPLYWVSTAVAYFYVLVGLGLCLRFLIRSQPPYRKQAAIIFTAMLAPPVCQTLYLANLRPFGGLNLTPYGLIFSGLFFAWAVFRYQFLNLSPVARRLVFQKIPIGVIVLDAQDRIVELNPVAQADLKAGQEVTGQKLELAAVGWPELIACLHRLSSPNRLDGSQLQEISRSYGSQRRFYTLEAASLAQGRRRTGERVVLLRDITARKQVEEDLLRRERALQALARAGVLLLSDTQLSDALPQVLQLLGEALDAQQVVLYENRPAPPVDQLAAQPRFLWSRPAAGPLLPVEILYQNLPPALAGALQSGGLARDRSAAMAGYGAFNIGAPGDKGGEQVDRELLLAPVQVGNNFWGFLRFDAQPGQDEWNSGEEAAIQTAAASIGAAIQHQLAGQQLVINQRELAAVEERERLARNLHDNLGQVMGYVNVQAQTAQQYLVNGQTSLANASLARLAEVAQDAHADIRNFILGLKGNGPNKRDFYTTLSAYIQQFTQLSGLPVQLNLPPEAFPSWLTPEAETQLLYIAKEALSNTRRHAHASQVTVNVIVQAQAVVLVISDNGIGFLMASMDGRDDGQHFGVQIMYERAAEAGGSLQLISAPGQGTQVIVHLSPVKPSPPRPIAGTRMLLVDDQPMFRDGLRNLLSARGLAVVGEASNGQQAVELALSLQPDIILMDIHMPVMDGLEALRRIKAEQPAARVVMLTVAETEDILFEAIRSGASGYLLKDLRAAEFFDLLERIIQGETSISPALAARMLKDLARSEKISENAERRIEDGLALRPEGAGLTPQQVDILKLVAQGHTYREVGQLLYISPATVKYHINEIIIKLQVNSRAEAVAEASRRGWLNK